MGEYKPPDDQPIDPDELEGLIAIRNKGEICEDTFNWLIGNDSIIDRIEQSAHKYKSRRQWFAIKAAMERKLSTGQWTPSKKRKTKRLDR